MDACTSANDIDKHLLGKRSDGMWGYVYNGVGQGLCTSCEEIFAQMERTAHSAEMYCIQIFRDSDALDPHLVMNVGIAWPARPVLCTGTWDETFPVFCAYARML